MAEKAVHQELEKEEVGSEFIDEGQRWMRLGPFVTSISSSVPHSPYSVLF